MQYSIEHLVDLFFPSVALAKMHKINTMLFEEEGDKELENRCLFYSIIDKRHTVSSNVIKIQLYDYQNGIDMFTHSIRWIR